MSWERFGILAAQALAEYAADAAQAEADREEAAA